MEAITIASTFGSREKLNSFNETYKRKFIGSYEIMKGEAIDGSLIKSLIDTWSHDFISFFPTNYASSEDWDKIFMEWAKSYSPDLYRLTKIMEEHKPGWEVEATIFIVGHDKYLSIKKGIEVVRKEEVPQPSGTGPFRRTHTYYTQEAPLTASLLSEVLEDITNPVNQISDDVIKERLMRRATNTVGPGNPLKNSTSS